MKQQVKNRLGAAHVRDTVQQFVEGLKVVSSSNPQVRGPRWHMAGWICAQNREAIMAREAD